MYYRLLLPLKRGLGREGSGRLQHAQDTRVSRNGRGQSGYAGR